MPVTLSEECLPVVMYARKCSVILTTLLLPIRCIANIMNKYARIPVLIRFVILISNKYVKPDIFRIPQLKVNL